MTGQHHSLQLWKSALKEFVQKVPAQLIKVSCWWSAVEKKILQQKVLQKSQQFLFSLITFFKKKNKRKEMGPCISTFFLKTSISGRWNTAATVDLPFASCCSSHYSSSSSSSSVPARNEHPFRRIKAPVCIRTEAGGSFCLVFSSLFW